MRLGRVIGRVVCSTKLACFDGLKLLLVQPLDERLREAGPAFVAWDTARAGEGDLVCVEAGKEAAQANPNGWYNPGDSAIVGIVDAVGAEGAGSQAAAGVGAST